MPFAYFGAKHRFARYYPPPAHNRIIEPFAGSAGYSVYWATPFHKVMLVDSDPLVIDMWLALQDANITEVLDEAEAQLTEDRVTSPFIYSIGGGLTRVKPGGSAKTSEMMRNMWPGIRRRIEAVLPMVRRWDIYHADYQDLVYPPESTIFVDAPYQPKTPGTAAHRYGEKRLDYGVLADWVIDRSDWSQMIVCEQGDADWLPFEVLQSHRTRMRKNDPQPRTEVMWSNQYEPDNADAQRRAASARRWARMKPREDKWAPRATRSTGDA